MITCENCLYFRYNKGEENYEGSGLCVFEDYYEEVHETDICVDFVTKGTTSSNKSPFDFM